MDQVMEAPTTMEVAAEPQVVGLVSATVGTEKKIFDAERSIWTPLRDGYLSRIDLASAARYLQIQRMIPPADSTMEEWKSMGAKDLKFEVVSDEEWKEEPKWTATPWDTVELALRGGVERMLLYGPPGVGKSYTPWSYAKEKGATFLSVTMTEMTPMSELRGHFLLKDKSTIWHDGICSRAWRLSENGKVVMVINEIDQAGMDSLTFLHNFLDDQEMAVIYLPTGEALRPTAGNIQVVATMNGIPEDLPTALRDRFSVQRQIQTPHPAAIASLPGWAQKWVEASYRASNVCPTFRQVKQVVELVNRGFHSSVAASLVFPEGQSHEAALMMMAKSDVW